ncbi:MAG: mechanosensitive ion channel family protein [Prevotellaceae bacterium]|jgi:miniconductance mechanosensitive channel|nr:mechanosensitive ion channel family protein [Prevotellaceae bacterium]
MIKQLEEILRTWMESLDVVSGGAWLADAILCICFLCMASGIYYAVKYVLIFFTTKFVVKRWKIWHQAVMQQRICKKIAFLPALGFVNAMTQNLFTEHHAVIATALGVVSAIVVGNLLSSCLGALEHVHSKTKYLRQHSIKSIVQTVQAIIFILTAIFCISIIAGVSVGKLLTALSAASAVLLLVFKDSILGLVSSIQLSRNHIVLPGDWIEVPAAGADGTVTEIALVSVKVRNWDNTIITIPTYDLITKPVKNWRGMSDSGVRRVKRSIYIDMSSVQFCTDEMLSRYRKIQYMAAYIDQKQTDIAASNEAQRVDTGVEMNGRRQTNLGIFKAYLQQYLEHHPQIDPASTLMARQLDPTNHGIPIEIYVFTKTTEWLVYEAIQGDIFDHVIAAVPYFDLRIFQNPSGDDYRTTTKALTESIRVKS